MPPRFPNWFSGKNLLRFVLVFSVALAAAAATLSMRKSSMTSYALSRTPSPLRNLEPPPLPWQAAAKEYYVSPTGKDSNDGSQAHPWASLQKAADQVGTGAMVHVAPGNYVGPIFTKRSGTEHQRIRFVSDQRWGARLRAASVDTVWTNLADYVDIAGFDISGTDEQTCNGIVNYGSEVRIMGNNVHDLGRDTTACVFGSGIVNHQNYAGHDDDVIGNVVHDIGDFEHPHQYHHGIYHANLRGHIWNNLVYRCQGWGIHLWHAATEVTIANNTIFNNGYGGILIGDGDDPGGFAAGVVDDRTVVSNNIVYRNGRRPEASGYGIEEYGRTGFHNQYFDNLVYQNGPRDWKLQNGLVARGTIAADPQFVNYQPDGTGNYGLKPTSPARASHQGSPLYLGATFFTNGRLPNLESAIPAQ